MKRITPEMILEFAEEQNIGTISDAYNDIISKITKALNDISLRNKAIINTEKIEISPINSFLLGTSTQTSELDILLSIESAQLELNSQQLRRSKWGVFKERVIFAWKNLRKKRRRKKKGSTAYDDSYKKDYSYAIPYNIRRLTNDLFDELAKNLLSTTIIYNKSSSYLKIVGQDEFGITININIGIKSATQTKFWSNKDNEFYNVNYNNYLNLIREKQGETGESFDQIERIFENLYYACYRKQPPQFIIPLIVCSIPTVLMKKRDVLEMFSASINYIKNINLKSFISSIELKDIISKKEIINELKLNISTFIKDVIKMLN